MGCDIHCYIDFVDFVRDDGGVWISNFAKDVHFPRNYRLFAAMAGVRDYEGTQQIFQPRGLPEDVSFVVKWAFTLYITDRDDPDEESCSREQAERWVKSGSSKYVDGGRYVTHPDWHTPSYLYVDELQRVKNEYEAVGKYKVGVPFEAIISAMDTLNDGNPRRSRLVFWFDN